MKMKRSEFKQLMMECLTEIVQDNPELFKKMISETIVEVVAKANARKAAVPQQRQQAQPVRQPARQAPQQPAQPTRPAQRPRPQAAVPVRSAGPEQLWEEIMHDTLTTTFQVQTARDQQQETDRMRRLMDFENSASEDESPIKHLRAAAMSPYAVQQQAAQSAQSRPQMVQREYAAPGTMLSDREDNGPSQALIEAAWRAGRGEAEQAQQQASHDPDMFSNVVSRKWDVDALPMDSSYNLDAIAAEMNSDLDS